MWSDDPAPDVAAVLDDAAAIERRDPSRLLFALASAGAASRIATHSATEATGRLDGSERPRALLLALESPAAGAAGVLQALAGDRVPVVAWYGAELPRWAGATDALLVASLSGHHPRLARLADQAVRRGLTSVVVTPGDSPLASAGGRGVVVEHDSGTPPRAAFWSLLSPLLVAAGRLQLVAEADRLTEAVADALDAMAASCRPSGEVFTNPAKSLAVEFAEATPVIAGAGPLAGIAARRFATSLALFAGRASSAVELPDDAAAAGALLEGGGTNASAEDDFFRDRVEEPAERPRLVVIGDDGRDDDPDLLRHVGDDPGELAARRAARALYEIAAARGVRASGLDLPEGPVLPRFAAATAFADFTAAYLAIGLGRDPGAERPGERPF